MSDRLAPRGVPHEALLWHAVFLELAMAAMALASDELFAAPAYAPLAPYLGPLIVLCLVGGGAALAVVSGVVAERFVIAAALAAALPFAALAVSFALVGATTGVISYGIEGSALVTVAWLAYRRAVMRVRALVVVAGVVLVALGLSMVLDPATYRNTRIYADLGHHLWLTAPAFLLGGAALLAAEAHAASRRAASMWPLLVAALFASIDLAVLVGVFASTGTWTGVLLYGSLGTVLLLSAPGAAFAPASPILLAAFAALGGALDLVASFSLASGGPDLIPEWGIARPGVALGALYLGAGFAVAFHERPRLPRLVAMLGLSALAVGVVSAVVERAVGTSSAVALIGATPSDTMLSGLPSGPMGIATGGAVLLACLWWPRARLVPIVLVAWGTAILGFVALNLLAFMLHSELLLGLYGAFAMREHAALVFGALGIAAVIAGVTRLAVAPIGHRFFGTIAALAVLTLIRGYVADAALSQTYTAAVGATQPAALDVVNDARMLGLLLLGATATAAGLFFIRTVTFPLHELLDAIGRARAGERRAQANVTSEDEIGIVARSFNQLTREVADQLELNGAVRRAQADLGEAMLILEEGEPRSWNDALGAISGYGDAGLAELGSILELWPEAERADVRALLRSRTHDTYRLETAIRKRDGSIAEVELAVHPLLTRRHQQLAIMRDITSAQQARRTLERLALHDTLTDLPNRVLFADRLRRVTVAANGAGGRFSVLYLDLDRFKDVNDAFGHESGDTLLRAVAARVAGSLSSADTLARFGGDEFAVLLPDAHDAAEATRVADRIHALLREPFALEGHDVFVEVSIGVVVFPDDGADADALLRHADIAMYEAKRPGKGVSAYSAEYDPHSQRRLELMSDLRHAVERDELRLHFQPQLLLDGARSVTSFEALLRWQHPAGPVSPAEFIPLAETSGFINELTLWVIRSAVDAASRLRDAGLPHRIALNVSARNLHYAGLADALARVLHDARVDPGHLTIEITETAVMADPARSLHTLTRLAALGVRLAIDDFGTGYTSLAHLQRLPVDELKIDRAFVGNMLENRSDDAIVSSVIALGHSLRLAVVAEGVEDARTLEALAAKGCDVAQGYHIARPMRLDDAVEWLRRREPQLISS